MGYSVEGRLALVTGAARGLGLAIAADLASRGARIVLTDVDEPRLAAATAALDGTGHVAHRLDVTSLEEIGELRGHLAATHGRIEVLVNNAGVVRGGPFLDLPVEDHLHVHRVNVLGTLAMTHAFLPDLVRAGDGRLVNVASASGFLALPWAASYASSKWSVVGLSESIRLELAELGHHGVRVTTLCPGYIRTGLFDGVVAPRLARTLSPAEVARAVVTAAERGRSRVLLPSMARLTPLLVALPSALADRVSRWSGVASSMKSWRGRAD